MRERGSTISRGFLCFAIAERVNTSVNTNSISIYIEHKWILSVFAPLSLSLRHMLFVASLARLYADVCGVQYTGQDCSTASLTAILDDTVTIPQWRPSSKVCVYRRGREGEGGREREGGREGERGGEGERERGGEGERERGRGRGREGEREEEREREGERGKEREGEDGREG